jgi:SAM-dependent methyltransferase
MSDPTLRFSSRVANYVKYRPRYPQAVLIALQDECQLTAVSPLADVGSGTGFLTELFLQNGNPVYAIEPNDEMRAAGERLLAHYPNFHSVPGRAEAATLPDKSVDFVVAGQAFHWLIAPQRGGNLPAFLSQTVGLPWSGMSGAPPEPHFSLLTNSFYSNTPPITTR